jgi:hypothetical protein
LKVVKTPPSSYSSHKFESAPGERRIHADRFGITAGLQNLFKAIVAKIDNYAPGVVGREVRCFHAASAPLHGVS